MIVRRVFVPALTDKQPVAHGDSASWEQVLCKGVTGTKRSAAPATHTLEAPSFQALRCPRAT
jgi:hypothetical protein